MKLPVISFPHLWHIGAFDLAQKRPGSLEGACLSVSNCPHAWREISNGLVSGTCYVADTSNIDLIDAHSLDDDTKAKIIEWGVKNGYAEACQIWTVSCDDCETEERTSFIVDNYANAIAELDLDLDDTDPEYQAEVDAAITSQLQHKGTDLLKSLALQVLPIIGDENLLDILLPLWAEDQTDFLSSTSKFELPILSVLTITQLWKKLTKTPKKN